MKRYPGMNLVRGMLLAPLLIAAACGGEQSVASKSAAAYREAQTKGAPVAGGHDHSATATGDAAIDHSAHGTGADAHAGMNHGATAAATSAHAGHTARPNTGGATHDQHAGVQHSAPSPAAADPHAQHRAAVTTVPAVAPAPRSNADMQRLQPAATLRRDAFDAPAPVSVSEAAKAAQGGGHEGHGTRGITAGEDDENPPTPMPATRDGSSRAPATDHSRHGAATVYACPMHPEVTSDKPGTCPKCGMALVKKK